MTRPIVIAAGGTGGHTFPAQATASALMARGHRVLLATDPRGAAFAAKVPGAELLPIRSATFSGRNPIKITMALSEILSGWRQARAAFRKDRPLAVVGFGGYPALPSMLAANMMGVPSVIHEPNAFLGRVNRLVAKRATKIATAFPNVALLPSNAAGKVLLIGNPVRPAIVAFTTPYLAPHDGSEINLLVFGGSQGARVLSEVLPAAIEALPETLRSRVRVTQQARGEDLAMVKAAYARLGVGADVSDFFTDLPQRLAKAHLVIARSGASTCAELTAMGRPSILVPYPFATDDHQSYNARGLAEVGAAIHVQQPQFTGAWLAAEIAALVKSPDRLTAMADAALRIGRPRAAEDFADAIEALGQ